MSAHKSLCDISLSVRALIERPLQYVHSGLEEDSQFEIEAARAVRDLQEQISDLFGRSTESVEALTAGKSAHVVVAHHAILTTPFTPDRQLETIRGLCATTLEAIADAWPNAKDQTLFWRRKPRVIVAVGVETLDFTLDCRIGADDA